MPWAYRVFARQVGVDPDTDRTPCRAGSRSTGSSTAGCAAESLLDDALTIAVAETGVPVIALDPDRIDGDPGPAPLPGGGERLGRTPPALTLARS